MSEQKRNNLTSLGTNKKDKKSKELSKTVRFTLNLPESNEEACPEFNYRVLLSSAEKKRKSKLTKGDGHMNGVDPLADDDDDDKLKEFARQLEEKYGGGGRKKHGRFEGYVDLGAGYDENDPFIDNTDAYDEVVPEEITTAHGGFYINCGELEFKEVSDQSDGEELKDLKVKKRVKKTFNAIEDDDGDDAAEGVKVSNVLQASKKPKAQEETNEELIKKRKLVAHDREILKKKKKRAIDDLMRKKAVTVKELLREKREYLEIESTAAVTESAQEQKKPVVNCLPKPTNTSIVDVIESVVSAARADDDSSKDSTSSVSKSVSGSVVSTDTEASQDAEVGEKEKNTPKEEVKLPEGVSDELRELVVLLRKAASSSADGKCKFFSTEVNQILLNVEQKCQELQCHSRHLVYGHLACYLPCTKDTLQKRAKKLRLLAEEVKIQEPLRKLEVAVASMMPSVMDKYSRECQRIAEEKSAEDPSSPSSEPDGEGRSPAEGVKSLKPLREKAKIPRRRFPWTTELRTLLCEVVRIKLQCLVLKKPRKDTAEEQLHSFLDQQVKPLWPPGWIKVTSLLRESRRAQTTVMLKSKKIALATKKQSSNLSLPLVPPSVSVPSTTTSVSATTTATITATITANNSTVRAPKGTTPPVPVAASRPPVLVATSRPPVPVTASRPPVPVTASRPPVPVAASRPPVPVAASRPPVPVAASRPPVSVAASRPPVPVLASRPPVPVAASRPPVPVAASRPPAPVEATRPPIPVAAPRPPAAVVASRPPAPVTTVKLKPASAVTEALPRPVVSNTSVVVPPTGVTMTVNARSNCSPVPVVAKSSVLPPVAVPRATLPVETFVKMPTVAVKTVSNTNLERQPTAIVRTVSNTNPDGQSPVQPMQCSPEVTLSKGNIDRVPVKGLDLSMSGASRPSTVPSAQNKVKSNSELSIIPVSVSSSSSSPHKSSVAALPLINIPDCISVTPSLPSPSQAASVTANAKPMMSLKQRILFDTAKERSNPSVNIVNTNMQPSVNNKDDGIEVIEIVDNTIKLNSFKVGNHKQRIVKSEVTGKPKLEAKKKKKVEDVKESIILSVSQVTSEPNPDGPPHSEKEAERRFNEETAAATDVLSQIINESLPDLPNSSRKEIYHNEEKPSKELNRQEEKQRKEIHYAEDKSKMDVYLEDKIKRDDKPRKEVHYQEEKAVTNTQCSGNQNPASPPPHPISPESKNGPYAEDELEWSEEAGDEKSKCETPQPADTEVSVQLEVDRVMKELIELQGHMSGGKGIDGSDTKYSSSKISSSVSVNPLSSAVISRSHHQTKSEKELDSPVVTCKPVLNTRRPSSGSEFSAAAKFSHGFQEEFQKHLFQDIPKQDLEPVSFQIGKSKGQIKPIAIHSRSSSPEGSANHGRSLISNTHPRSHNNSNSASLYSKLASVNMDSYTGVPYVSRLPTSANSFISHFQDIKSNAHGSQQGSNQHSPPF